MSMRKGRGRALISVVVLVLLGCGGGAWWYLGNQHQESTDDAYVSGNVVPVMPRIGGNVIAIHGDDTQLVKAGMPLVELDPADAQLAMQRAQIQLAQAVRQVQQDMATLQQYEASIALRQAELDKLQGDQSRREVLGMTNAVGREEVLHARQGVMAGKAALEVAIQQRNSLRVKLKQTPLAEQPEVRHAAELLRQAWLDLQRTEVLAPVTGIIAKRSVQLGSHVNEGTAMLAIVPMDDLWVDANFKEVQLEHLRIGQPATLTADVYGSKVEYHGHVEGLSAGTGSVFSLLPAQNATGNWLKVVQRLPVRIRLDAAEVLQNPLRLGLSMQVSVDVSKQEGERVLAAGADSTRKLPAELVPDSREADKLIARIIAENMQQK